jgi:hypothetical protein
MPQYSVIEISSDDESDEPSLRSLLERNRHEYKCFWERFKLENSARTGMA